MVFVQRDAQGVVTGLYANKQPGYAEEELPDDHSDVAAFHERANNQPPPRDLAAEIDALKAAVIEKTAVTEEDIVAKRKTP